MDWGHDGTISGIHIDWRLGNVEIPVRVVSEFDETKTLVCNDFKDFSLPRKHEWGPSNSINEIYENRLDDQTELKIELQSGDVLRVICENVEVK